MKNRAENSAILGNTQPARVGQMASSVNCVERMDSINERKLSDNLSRLRQQVFSDDRARSAYAVETQMSRISLLLKEIRKSKHLTQQDIADKTGLSRQMISKIETYNGNPSLSTLLKYCLSMNIDLFRLLADQYYKV